MKRQMFATAIVLVTWTTTATYGSRISTGPMGINSRDATLRLPDGVTPLTGGGVKIGQVEINRPGWPIESGGPDSVANSNPFVRPTDVVLSAGDPVVHDMGISDHATWVAGVMISKDMTDDSTPANNDDPRGVAPDAMLYSSAYEIDGAGIGYTESLLSAQYIAQIPGMLAINHSWQKVLPPGGAPLTGEI